MKPCNTDERNRMHQEALDVVERFKAQGGVVQQCEIIKREVKSLSIKEVSRKTYAQRMSIEEELNNNA